MRSRRRPTIYEIAGQYVDVVSINDYEYAADGSRAADHAPRTRARASSSPRNPWDDLDTVERLAKRPIMITEFGYRARSRTGRRERTPPTCPTPPIRPAPPTSTGSSSTSCTPGRSSWAHTGSSSWTSRHDGRRRRAGQQLGPRRHRGKPYLDTLIDAFVATSRRVARRPAGAERDCMPPIALRSLAAMLVAGASLPAAAARPGSASTVPQTSARRPGHRRHAAEHDDDDRPHPADDSTGRHGASSSGERLAMHGDLRQPTIPRLGPDRADHRRGRAAKTATTIFVFPYGRARHRTSHRARSRARVLITYYLAVVRGLGRLPVAPHGDPGTGGSSTSSAARCARCRAPTFAAGRIHPSSDGVRTRLRRSRPAPAHRTSSSRREGSPSPRPRRSGRRSVRKSSVRSRVRAPTSYPCSLPSRITVSTSTTDRRSAAAIVRAWSGGTASSVELARSIGGAEPLTWSMGDALR